MRRKYDCSDTSWVGGLSPYFCLILIVKVIDSYICSERKLLGEVNSYSCTACN